MSSSDIQQNLHLALLPAWGGAARNLIKAGLCSRILKTYRTFSFQQQADTDRCMESILWMDMLAYPQNLSGNLQSDKYTDMLAYPYLLEFSLNHNYLQSVLNFPQPRKYEFNLSDKGTSLPRALIISRFFQYLLGIKHESCTGIFKSLKLLQLKMPPLTTGGLGKSFL